MKIQLTNQNMEPAGSAERMAVLPWQRVKTGFRAGGLFWILACCSLPIPLMHFILVPLFVTLGTMQAWSRWTSQNVLRNGQSACPKCQASIKFDDLPEKWPVKVLCPSCGFQLRLSEGA